MSTLKVLYPEILDIGCFSHTIDHVGEKFCILVLNEFVTAWIGLFSRSPKSRLAWQARTGFSVKTYSQTRWWSRYEVIDQLLNVFGDIQPFLEENYDAGPALCPKMLASHTARSNKEGIPESGADCDSGCWQAVCASNLQP